MTAVNASKDLSYRRGELLVTVLSDAQYDELHADLQPSPTSGMPQPEADAAFPTLNHQHPVSMDYIASPDSCPQHPHILALEKAIGLLKSHADDARTNIVNLRALLAQRDTEPALYKSLQRQRWAEERRELKATQVLQSTYRRISSIMDNSPISLSSTESSTGSKSLEQFFELTKQRTPITAHHLPRQNPAHNISDPPASRIHHHSDMLPLLLKPRCEQPEPPPRSSPSMGNRSSVTSAVSEPQTPIVKSGTTLTPTPSTKSFLKPASHYSALLPQRLPFTFDGSGTATIYRSRVDERPTAEAIVDTDVEVTMPDYVAELLSEFDGVAVEPPSMPKPSIELVVPHRRPSKVKHIKKVSSNKRISGFFSKVPDAFSSHGDGGDESAKRRSAASVSSLALSANGDTLGRTDRKIASRLRRQISSLRK